MTSFIVGLVALISLGLAPSADSVVKRAPSVRHSFVESLLPRDFGAKFAVLAQGDAVQGEAPAATTGSAASGAAANGAAPATATPAGAKRPEDMTIIEQLFASGIILPIGVVVLFYAIYLAPERRRKAEEAKLMAGLKKNDRVVTVGGIHGTVVNVTSDSDILTLKVDESSGTRLRVNRSAIARVVTDPASTQKDASADDSAT